MILGVFSNLNNYMSLWHNNILYLTMCGKKKKLYDPLWAKTEMLY